MLLLLLFIAGAATTTAQTFTDPQNAGLKQHNLYRAKHGAPAMTLNATLCSAATTCAQYYASKKTIDHSCTTAGAGENLYMSWGSATVDATAQSIAAIDSWYNENKGYNYQNPGSSSGVTGHFTQLVWKGSTQLGVGVSTVNGYTVVVGKYVPYGNILSGGSDRYSLYKQNVLPPTA